MGLVKKSAKTLACSGLSCGLPVAIFIVVFVAAAISLFLLVVPHRVAGTSMAPTLKDGDYVLGLKTNVADVNRGDIVVYKMEIDGERFDYVGRIVGVPGDEIEITDGVLYINGEAESKEHYKDASKLFSEDFIGTDAGEDMAAIELDDDEYFVLGDNRENSLDSRGDGPIREDDISDRLFHKA